LEAVGTEIRGLKETLATLNKFAPETVKRLRRDMRSEIKPLVTAIQAVIPSNAPLSGMDDNKSRLGWHTRQNPKKIGIQSALGTPRRKGPNSLLTLTIESAATSLVDKAGLRNDRFSKRSNPTFSRNLQRKGVGVNRLKGVAQRFGWPTALRNRKLIDTAILNIVKKVEQETNLKFRVGRRVGNS